MELLLLARFDRPYFVQAKDDWARQNQTLALEHADTLRGKLRLAVKTVEDALDAQERQLHKHDALIHHANGYIRALLRMATPAELILISSFVRPRLAALGFSLASEGPCAVQPIGLLGLTKDATRDALRTNTLTTIGSVVLPPIAHWCELFGGNLCAVGGYNGHAVDTMELFEPSLGEWQARPRLAAPRFGHSVIVLDRELIALGGTSFTGVISSTEQYDIEAGVWRTRRAMTEARASFGAVLFDDRILIFGGTGLSVRQLPVELASVASYHLPSNTWTDCAPIPVSCQSMGVVVLNRAVFLIGGQSKGQAMNHVLMYDVAADVWTPMPSLPAPVVAPAVTVFRDEVYVIGGFDGDTNPVATVARLDPVTGSWNVRAPLATPRGSLAACVGAGGIFALGGARCWLLGSPTDLVERYDPLADEWSPCPPLSAPRAGLAAVAVLPIGSL